jgi:hypothetical protein
MRCAALTLLALSLPARAFAAEGCESDFSVNQFVGNMNKAEQAMADFDLDLFRNVLDLTYAQLACSVDRVHPNHMARFARMQAQAAFFDQDELNVEYWSAMANQKAQVPWGDEYAEDHPFRMTLEGYGKEEWTVLSGAFLYPPAGGGVTVNGWLVLEPKAPAEGPNFVQVSDKSGSVIDGFWMEGTTFPNKVLRGDDGAVAAPEWWTEPDLALDPKAEIKLDPKEVERRERLAAERPGFRTDRCGRCLVCRPHGDRPRFGPPARACLAPDRTGRSRAADRVGARPCPHRRLDPADGNHGGTAQRAALEGRIDCCCPPR